MGTIAQLCRAISSQLRHYRQSEKKLLSSNMSSTCPHNMVNFGLLAAEIGWRVWGTPQISTGFASWQCYCMASSSGHQPKFAALNRGRLLYSAGRNKINVKCELEMWALAHISSFHCFHKLNQLISQNFLGNSQLLQLTPLRRTLVSSPESECASCRQ